MKRFLVLLAVKIILCTLIFAETPIRQPRRIGGIRHEDSIFSEIGRHWRVRTAVVSEICR
jgi:hypothetical protein